jgi:predicted O-methyltransferase YrrM
MPNEHEFTGGRNPLLGDKDELWSADSVDGSETEVNEFLYSLVRMIKPEFVVETGCYLGDGTVAIARAIRDNEIGRMLTCDIDKEKVNSVNLRLRSEGLIDFAEAVHMRGVDLIKQCNGMRIDFAFIDSGGEKGTREEEINELIPIIRPLTMFALHDTAPQHVGMRKVAESVKCPSVYFNTPRGLTLFQNIVPKTITT